MRLAGWAYRYGIELVLELKTNEVSSTNQSSSLLRFDYQLKAARNWTSGECSAAVNEGDINTRYEWNLGAI